MTLVDQARALSKKVDIPNYSHRVKLFANDPRHRFIQELRVDMIHVRLHDPSWQITTGRDEERTTRFLLKADQLRRLDEYHSLAKQFVLQDPDGVDLGRTISDYRATVEEFQSWLRLSVEEIAQADLEDLSRCWKVIQGFSARSFWQIILLQVLIQGKRDPYNYLSKELTDAELAEVLALPHRSKTQVDRIIEIVDNEQICDEELRQIVYRAFGTTDA